MLKNSITPMLGAVMLVNFLLMPVVAWGETRGKAGDTPSLPPLQTLDYDIALLLSENVSGDGYSSGLSLTSSAEAMFESQPDWDGLTKDTAYFLAYQLSIIGVLYVMPASISGWTDETKEDFSIQQYKDNVRQVVWDKDDWWLNYVLHPYWGGVYYVRAQQRGFGPMGSFMYAVTLSSLYEFGAEAFFEEPSIQDLIVTPVAGYFVGKYFMEVRANIHKKPAGTLSATDKFVLVMTDPMGAMNEVVEGWFGNNSEASLRLMIGPQFQTSAVSDAGFNETTQTSYIGTSTVGMKMTLRW